MEAAASEPAVGQHAEPALHEIDPRGVRRREVHVESWMMSQRSSDRRRLVRVVVVEDQVHVEVLGDRAVHDAKELDELRGPVAPVAPADDLAGLGVECREVRRGPVPHVIVGAPLGNAWAHRQERLRPFQGLHLALLIDTEHESLVPLGRVVRRSLQRHRDDAFDRLFVDVARRTGPGRINQAVQSHLGELAPPLADSWSADPEFLGDLGVGPSIAGCMPCTRDPHRRPNGCAIDKKLQTRDTRCSPNRCSLGGDQVAHESYSEASHQSASTCSMAWTSFDA